MTDILEPVELTDAELEAVAGGGNITASGTNSEVEVVVNIASDASNSFNG